MADSVWQTVTVSSNPIYTSHMTAEAVTCNVHTQLNAVNCFSNILVHLHWHSPVLTKY